METNKKYNLTLTETKQIYGLSEREIDILKFKLADSCRETYDEEDVVDAICEMFIERAKAAEQMFNEIKSAVSVSRWNKRFNDVLRIYEERA